MTTITTTLADIRVARPCKEGYKTLVTSLGGSRKYGSKTPINIRRVLDSNGFGDTIWVLGNACGEEGEELCYSMACDFAEHVLHFFEDQYPKDKRPRAAIETRRKWIKGEATNQELFAAFYAASNSIFVPATYITYAAKAAADSAGTIFLSRENAAISFDAIETVTSAADAANTAANAAASLAAAISLHAEREWQQQHLRKLLEE